MDTQATLVAPIRNYVIRLGVSTTGTRLNTASTSQTSALREELLSIFNPRRHNNRCNMRVTARSTISGVNRSAEERQRGTDGRQRCFFLYGLFWSVKKSWPGLEKIKLDLEI